MREVFTCPTNGKELVRMVKKRATKFSPKEIKAILAAVLSWDAREVKLALIECGSCSCRFKLGTFEVIHRKTCYASRPPSLHLIEELGKSEELYAKQFDLTTKEMEHADLANKQY